MCYGISQAYKESTNCRLEAQYAFQQELDMVRHLSAPHCHPHHIICTTYMIGTTFAPGATDDGGGVSRQGLAWYATRCAAVLPILWRGARERNGVRGEGRGAVPRAWGARESARRTNVNGNFDSFILWHLLCVLLRQNHHSCRPLHYRLSNSSLTRVMRESLLSCTRWRRWW